MLSSILYNKDYSCYENRPCSEGEVNEELQKKVANVYNKLIEKSKVKEGEKFLRLAPQFPCKNRDHVNQLFEFSETLDLPPSIFDSNLLQSYTNCNCPNLIASYFSDNEIIETFNVIDYKREIGGFLSGLRTSYEQDKVVIPQTALRSCTAACSAMLIYDRKIQSGEQIKSQLEEEISSRDLGNDEDIVRDIKQEGYTPRLVKISSLKEAKDLIENNGNASFTIGVTDPVAGGHQIVCDCIILNKTEELEEEGVVIRDPYHGWKIKVSLEAFEERTNLKKGATVIQIQDEQE